MKILLEPKVTVVAHTTFLGHPDYPIPADGSDAVKTCAFAAKGCYDSYGAEGRPNAENQAAILSSGHGSVLEHFSVSLFIEGITRACSLELNRHRHFAISQRSTRYTAEGDAAIVLDPYFAELYREYGEEPEGGEVPLETPAQTLLWDHLEWCRQAILEYETEVKTLVKLNPEGLSGTDLRKWARGKARNLLPHALETRGTWTGNLRAWRHFIELRSERHAEPEIRRLADEVFDALYSVAAFYLSDYTVKSVRGLREYATPFRKV